MNDTPVDPASPSPASPITEQTLITSSYGLNHLPQEIAFGKLEATADTERVLRG